MLKIGKHVGCSFTEVAKSDRSYCAWVLRTQDLPRSLKKFKMHLVDTHGGMLTIGKYRGKFFDEVMKEDEDYCQWVMSLRTSDPGAFGDFITFMLKNPPVEPPAKKKRGDEGTDTCKICFDQEIDTVLVPCGHVVACSSCAERLQDKPCPICKSGVCFVQKTYRA